MPVSRSGFRAIVEAIWGTIVPQASRTVHTSTMSAGIYSVIKSINYYSGTVTVANNFTGPKDVTINAVQISPLKAFILLNGYAPAAGRNGGVDNQFGLGAPFFNTTTTVRFTVTSNNGNGDGSFNYAFFVIEFW